MNILPLLGLEKTKTFMKNDKSLNHLWAINHPKTGKKRYYILWPRELTNSAWYMVMTYSHIKLWTTSINVCVAECMKYLCSLQDEVMDDDLLFITQTKFVSVDEGYSKCGTVHRLLSAGPIHKLILCLWEHTSHANNHKSLFLSQYELFLQCTLKAQLWALITNINLVLKLGVRVFSLIRNGRVWLWVLIPTKM